MAQEKAPAACATDRSALPTNPVDRTVLERQTMGTGNGGTSRGFSVRGSPHRVGANDMLREQRRPAEAKARGNAPDRLTAGRGAERERSAAEVTRHNTGSRAPAGGLARHPLEARRAAWLPPPHAPVPSDATGRRPNGTHPPQPVEHVLVGAAVRGASGDPRPSRATHGGGRRGAIVPPTPTRTAR